jgi:hypothetical protein
MAGAVRRRKHVCGKAAFFFPARHAMKCRMKLAPPRPAFPGFFLLLFGLLAASPPAQAADDAAATLCRTNPAYSVEVMGSVLNAQLAKDHDPALDAESPDQMAAEAVEQGVSDCATELRRDPRIFQTLVVLRGNDMQIGWDAFNTACDDRKVSKADCIKAEVGAVQALKRMVATDKPPGSAALVQTCELVLQSDPAMAEWRVCVDQSLAAHATPDAAKRCKTSVTWHVAKTGADAARVIGACLKGG